MEHRSALIVQAEFFLVPLDGSLEDVQERISNRTAQGQQLKTCVRFFDTRGLVGKAAMCAHVAEARSQALLEVLALSTDAAHTTEFGAPHQSAVEEFRVRKNDLRRCVIRELRFAMSKNLAVAFEQNDRSYRPMLVNEFESLTQTIARSTDLWVFLFPPNNLLANEHTDSLAVM